MSDSELTPSGRIVEKQLDCHLQSVEKTFNSDALAFVGPLFHGVDQHIREAIEFVHKNKSGAIRKRPKLSVIIETPGGYSAVAERICGHYAQAF